jgi:hypothetical protein
MNPESENLVREMLSGVEKLADAKIKSREDLEIIINIAVKDEKLASLEEISFHAKVVYGLFKIIQRKEDVADEEFFSKAAEEYKENIVKLKMLLNYLIGDNNSFIKNIFLEKYFQLTQMSLSNLNDLCSDLSYVKLYFNDKKHVRS